MNQRGMVHVYYGDGAGKTTAAIGMIVRSAGWGRRTAIVQFLKDTPSGEVLFFEKGDNITVFRSCQHGKFVSEMSDAEKKHTKEAHDSNFLAALRLAEKGEIEVLLLDELMDAVLLGLVEEEPIRSFLKDKSQPLEVIITGHKPVDWILGSADYITHMQKERHPFDKGVMARKGIEF